MSVLSAACAVLTLLSSRPVRRAGRDRGDSFQEWARDRLGIETMLTNRMATGRGLSPPRFGWVPFADALLFPLDNAGVGKANPDYHARIEGTDRLLKSYMAEARVSAPPPTLDGYLARGVTPSLERWKRGVRWSSVPTAAARRGA